MYIMKLFMTKQIHTLMLKLYFNSFKKQSMYSVRYSINNVSHFIVVFYCLKDKRLFTKLKLIIS
jgi:hypothetical protein